MPRWKPPFRFNPDECRSIAAEYDAGVGTSALAKKWGSGLGAIRSAVVRGGGQLRPLLKDLTDREFGNLIVLRRDPRRPNFWVCQCDCGNKKSVRRGSLTSGDVQSCGCLRSRKARDGSYTIAGGAREAKRFTKDEDGEIVRRREAGESFILIGQRLGRCTRTVRNRWKRISGDPRYIERRRAVEAARRSPGPKRDRDRKTTHKRLATARGRFTFLVKKARSRSARSGRPFDLSREYLERLWESQGGKCYYTGLPMTLEVGSDHTVSLDRLDNDRGYEVGNVVLCCRRVNAMKECDTLAIFVAWCRRVADCSSRRLVRQPSLPLCD